MAPFRYFFHLNHVVADYFLAPFRPVFYLLAVWIEQAEEAVGGRANRIEPEQAFALLCHPSM
jgi:hypothetical protein